MKAQNNRHCDPVFDAWMRLLLAIVKQARREAKRGKVDAILFISELQKGHKS